MLQIQGEVNMTESVDNNTRGNTLEFSAVSNRCMDRMHLPEECGEYCECFIHIPEGSFHQLLHISGCCE